MHALARLIWRLVLCRRGDDRVTCPAGPRPGALLTAADTTADSAAQARCLTVRRDESRPPPENLPPALFGTGHGGHLPCAEASQFTISVALPLTQTDEYDLRKR